jgi:glucose-1-phosphate thymidylyltransferase
MMALRDAEDLDVVLLVRKVSDPRRYGVVEGTELGRIAGARHLKVTGMQEKPEKPRSHWAATAVYAFSARIFGALRAVAALGPAELEVTDAIRWLIERGGRVEALVLAPALGEWRSVGSPDGYLRALRRTHGLTSRPVRGAVRATHRRKASG